VAGFCIVICRPLPISTRKEENMKSFSFIRKVNHIAAVVSGVLIFIISFLCTWEMFVRNVLSRPTSWTLDISSYILIWVFFLATAAAIQEKTHVSVDFIRNMVGDKFGKTWSRILAIAGYVFSLVYILVLLGTTILFIKDALHLDKLTLGIVQIPIVYLYLAMLIGCILMIVVVIFIILDLLRQRDEYL
jgi:TRAP-type C4-dicarboxylate transport system permease small subunit